MSLELSLCKLSVSNKPIKDTWFISQFANVLETAEKDGFYKASLNLLPHISKKADTDVIQFTAPYGVYTSTVGELKAVMSEVITSRNELRNEYTAIEKANKILQTKSAFTLKGNKPQSKKGKPKAEHSLD